LARQHFFFFFREFNPAEHLLELVKTRFGKLVLLFLREGWGEVVSDSGLRLSPLTSGLKVWSLGFKVYATKPPL